MVKKKPKSLSNAKKDAYFGLADGVIMKSLFDLANELENMSDELFSHHVTSEKNDFSKWVEHVFDEKTLAKELAGLEKRAEAQVCVLKFLVKKLK